LVQYRLETDKRTNGRKATAYSAPAWRRAAKTVIFIATPPAKAKNRMNITTSQVNEADHRFNKL